MRILIIEDEQLAREELKRQLAAIGGHEVVGEASSVKAAVEWFKGHAEPELILMDIQLEDDVCFEIFEKTRVSSPVIFTTAYDEYALKAFSANGVGYLLKPIDSDELCMALKRVEEFAKGRVADVVREMMSRYAMPKEEKKESISRFSIKTGESYTMVLPEEVAYFVSDEHYTFLRTRDGRKSIITPSLGELEERLDSKMFFRVSRNFIINIAAIERASKHFNGRMKLKVKPEHEEEVFVSRNRVKEFMEWFGLG